MANLISVKVSKISAKASKNGNFIHTLKTEGKVVKVLGIDKMSGALTYFIALPEKAKLNKEFEIDMDLFEVKVRPFETGEVDDETGEAVVLPLKWLHIK